MEKGFEKIGWHTSVANLNSESIEYFDKCKTFQVFIGPPKRLQIPNLDPIKLLLSNHLDLDIVVHGPYVVSLCKSISEPIVQATLSYYSYLANNLKDTPVKYIVTHIGGLSKGDDIKMGAVYIYDFCLRWLAATPNSNMILCLENDVGSKKGTKMGYIKILASIVKKINSPRIRLCLDVQHSYGAGFNLTEDKLDILNDYVSVVHFNAVPKYVEFGSHVDRHSETSLDESKVDQFLVYKKLYNGVRPFIFEVNGEPYISRNIEWLRGKLLKED